MLIKYIGEYEACNVNVYGSLILGWKKGEIKDLDEKSAKKLLENKKFVLVSEGKKAEVVVSKPIISNEMDLDKDGNVDGADATIAARTLANYKKFK